MDMKPGKKWECSKCSKRFKANSALTRHVVTHDPDVKVKCEICGIISKNRLALSYHLSRFHSNRKQPSCDTCHQVFATITTLRRHIEAIHGTKERPRFSCTYPGCEKTYQNERHISQHVRTEHAQNPVRFPCILCGKEFKTRAELGSHIPTHTTEKPYNCSTCGKSFAHRTNMKLHQMTHLEKSTRDVIKCQVCPQTFVSKITLQRHIRVVHENRRNYPCSFCDKIFCNSTNLKVHVEAIHDTDKELVHSCDNTGLTRNIIWLITEYATMQRGMDVTSVERNSSFFPKSPHIRTDIGSVNTCHRVFFDFVTIRKHIEAIHSIMNRPRVPCRFPGCEKTYKNNTLWGHVKIDHSENAVRIQCTLCDKDFKTRGHLKQHIPTHTTEKPYNCATCGRNFARMGSIQRHQNTNLQSMEKVLATPTPAK
ncbi:Zinc finger protein 90 [Folsomia candida]|uniref:Zinc finger protein 90 n=1 Tax=Folsomia candida TaxID=158441 RepID=A0A226DJQ4_FOLCA|nr:Zinc finger protein 90 [Folsomia candida]